MNNDIKKNEENFLLGIYKMRKKNNEGNSNEIQQCQIIENLS